MKKSLNALLFLLVISSCGKNLSDNSVNYANQEAIIIPGNNRVTPMQAADIGTAITDIFCNEETKSSIRKILSVEAITSAAHLTKGEAAATDTLMYIVNYANDKGYTFISSDRRSGPVIAFVEQGNFSISDTIHNSLDKMLVDLMISYQTTQMEKFRTEDDKLAKELSNKELYGFFYDDETDVYTKKTILWSSSTGLYGLSGKNCRNVLVSGPGIYPHQYAPKHPLDYYPINGCEGFKDHWELSGGVDPLLTTSWHQESPFNNMAPINPNKVAEHAYTGCVAIAVAQIMAYNNYPLHYPKNYNNGATTWLGSLRQFKTGDQIKAARCENEVATLLYTIGVMLKNEWGFRSATGDQKRGTSAWSNEVIPTFNKMGYKIPNATYRLYNSQKIFNELLRKRVVYIEGANQSLNSAHAWVIDGYKTMLIWRTKYYFDYNGEYDGEIKEKSRVENIYYNCNFGWGGIKNGYYLEQVFDTNKDPFIPTKGKDYNFSYYMNIITGLKD